MDRNKARKIVTDFMQGLWPRWNTTWMLQEEWTSILQSYSEVNAKKAISLMFRKGRSSIQPFPNEFAAFMRSLASQSDKVEGPRPMAGPPAYVMFCKVGRMVGMTLPMYGCEKWPLIQKDKILESWRHSFEHYYGGEWMCVEGTTWSELTGLRHKLWMAYREAKPIPDEPSPEPEDYNHNRLMPDVPDSIPF